MTPFYRWVSTVSRLQSQYEKTLLYTNKSPGVPGTHFINLGSMKN